MENIYPPDYETEVGQVRLLIPDTATDTGDADGSYVFDDAQISGFLRMSGDHILRAGAMALYTLANDTALLLKHVRTYDLAVNGPAVAEALQKSAKGLLDRADKQDEQEQFDGAFQVVSANGGECWPEGAIVPRYGRIMGVGRCR